MNDDNPQQLVIDIKTAEAVVNYLAARPYVEVFQLIAAMQQLASSATGLADRDHCPAGGARYCRTQS